MTKVEGESRDGERTIGIGSGKASVAGARTAALSNQPQQAHKIEQLPNNLSKFFGVMVNSQSLSETLSLWMLQCLSKMRRSLTFANRQVVVRTSI